ncbi:MAG: oligosaccharide flippase family protein [Actinobacteria bacterium]|nr:oligosaccharide flippase family protein [Actinomycetota bacterium]
MSLVKKFSYGLIWNQFAKIVEFGLAFILSFILARGFGPKVYGLYTTAIALSTLAIFISSMGFDEVLNTYIAKLNAQSEQSKAYYLFSKLLSGRFLVSVICGLIVFFFSDSIAKLFGLPEAARYFRLIVFYLIFLSASNLMVMYFMGSMRVRLIALTKVFAAAATLVFSYLSLKSGYGIVGQIVVITAVSFVAFSVYLVFSSPDLFKQKEKFNITPMLKFGYPVWGISFLSYALGKQMDIMLIGYFLHSAKQIGFYNIAYGLQLMIASLLLAGTDFYCSRFGCKSWRRRNKHRTSLRA